MSSASLSATQRFDIDRARQFHAIDGQVHAEPEHNLDAALNTIAYLLAIIDDLTGGAS